MVKFEEVYYGVISNWKPILEMYTRATFKPAEHTPGPLPPPPPPPVPVILFVARMNPMVVVDARASTAFMEYMRRVGGYDEDDDDVAVGDDDDVAGGDEDDDDDAGGDDDDDVAGGDEDDDDAAGGGGGDYAARPERFPMRVVDARASTAFMEYMRNMLRGGGYADGEDDEDASVGADDAGAGGVHDDEDVSVGADDAGAGGVHEEEVDAEEAKSEGYKVEEMVIVGDDSALPPPRGIAGRRGLAGTILVHKAAYAQAQLKANSHSGITTLHLAGALEAAIAAVSKYGGAKQSYWMLDLIPALTVFKEKFVFSAEAAVVGAESTKNMPTQVNIAPELLDKIVDRNQEEAIVLVSQICFGSK